MAVSSASDRARTGPSKRGVEFGLDRFELAQRHALQGAQKPGVPLAQSGRPGRGVGGEAGSGVGGVGGVGGTGWGNRQKGFVSLGIS